MIHNEVTALERTYSDNRSRMRALIQELASQREAVITNTDASAKPSRATPAFSTST